MAPQTRSITKKLAQVDYHYHAFLSPSTPLPQKITRSVTRNLKLLGITIPKIQPLARITKRRNTCFVAKPARRTTRRIHTIQGEFILYIF